MKRILGLAFLLLCLRAVPDTTITNLPAVTGANVGSNDVLPFVQLSTGRTAKLKLSQILSIPSLANPTLTSLSLGAGSVSVPALNFGDASTGFYAGATNELRATINGSLRLRMASNLMHGPQNFYLNVEGSAATQSFIGGGLTDGTVRISGDNFPGTGGEIKLGSRDSAFGQATKFYNAATETGGISAAGKWTIGASGGTQLHKINGILVIGDGTTGDIYRPDAAGLAFEVGNGQNYSLGAFNVRNAASTQNNLIVTDLGNVTLGPPSYAGTHAINGSTTQTFTTANTASILTVLHSDNTQSGSRAIIRAQGGGTSGGDPVMSWYVNGGQEWMAGIDVSDSNAWVLAASGALGSSNVLRFTTAGVGLLSGSLTIQSSSGPMATLKDGGTFGTNADPSLYFNDTSGNGAIVGYENAASNDFSVNSGILTGAVLRLKSKAGTSLAVDGTEQMALSTSAISMNLPTTISPGSGADVNALIMRAGTTTGTVRNYWRNSNNTRSFEMDADFSSGTEFLLFQSDNAGLGGVARDGAWSLGGNGLTPIHRFNVDTQSTVGAAGGASALPATPTGFIKVKINGTTTYVIPYYAAS